MAEPTFEQLMQVSYDQLGLDGSPVRLPAWVRRAWAKLAASGPMALGLSVWGLHRLWALGGTFVKNPTAQFWRELANEFRPAQTDAFARAVFGLDAHGTFQRGCAVLGYRNVAEALFHRSGFLDAFFHQDDWPHTEFTDPHQRPHFFLPGIPARRLYQASDFPWTSILRENFQTIRLELTDLLAKPRGFGNYRTEYGNLMPGWNTFHFYLQGEAVEENCRRCPLTSQLLASLPRLEKEFILFSALNPQSRIIPHVGTVNGILRFHLGLLVPEECGLRVGGQVATWEEGEVLVFDDAFVHEVWNHSDQLRVVLFLNLWHPCLSTAETGAIARLQRAYNRLPGGVRWKEAQIAIERPTLETRAQA